MSAAPRPRVAIILLNYNGLELTRECLRSLAALQYPAWRALVVDNGSAADETVPLRAEFGDGPEWIRVADGRGFCEGNNLAMRRALDQGYDYLLLLNNDTTVEPDFLGPLIELMEADPSIGIAGPKIVRYFDRSRLDSIGGDIRMGIARHVHFRKPYPETRTDLTFVHGAAFLVRRAALEQVGFLDPDYFAYWEEGDYCLRARRAGWKIACVPRSVVYHKVGQTNRFLSNFYIYYMVRNGFVCMRKNAPPYLWPSFTVCFLGTSVAKYFAYLLVKRPRDLPILFQAIADFMAGRLGRKAFASARPTPS